MAISRLSIGHAIYTRKDCNDWALPIPSNTAALSKRIFFRVVHYQTRSNENLCNLWPQNPSFSHVYSPPHIRRSLRHDSFITSCKAESTSASTSPPSQSEPSTSDRSNSKNSTPSTSAVPQPSAAPPPPPADQPSGARGSTPVPPTDAPATGSKGRRFPSFQLPPRPRHVPLTERITDLLVNTSTPPIGSYMSEPLTVLHRLDPRVKQVWLMALVFIPARSGLGVKVALAALVAAMTALTLPTDIWKDQLSRQTLLCLFLFMGIAFGTDGAPFVSQPRSPPPLLTGLPPLPPPLGGYRYVLFKFGFLQLSRKGAMLGGKTAALSFILLQSASLCLTTTSPERVTQSIHWFLNPLKRFGAPIDEVVLTLLLSLRFTGLVFDEVRNLALGVVARGVQWKTLKLQGSVDVLASLFGRFFKNMFKAADQIALAMMARGFKGQPQKHKIYFLEELSMGYQDWVALALLVVLWVGSTYLDLLI